MNLPSTTIGCEPLNLAAGVVAFSTQRGCCNPSDPYDGFNACSYTGDDPAHIEACRHRLGMPYVMPRPTHSLNVAIVSSPCEPVDVDAIVTSERRLALCINTADCVPVVLADPEAGVIAAVHSGWKGTVGRITARAVDAMVAIGAVPSRIHAAMGPCICRGCFEVGHEVAALFRDASLSDAVVDLTPKPHVDLPAAVAMTLAECGVSPDAVAMPCGCSRCRPDRWFSARKLGVNSGRTLTVVYLP